MKHKYDELFSLTASIRSSSISLCAREHRHFILPDMSATASIPQQQSTVSRPIANFHPSVWGNQFLDYTPPPQEVTDARKQEHQLLKAQVRKELLRTLDNPSDMFHLVDTVERLGVAYHFDKEISDCLRQIYDAYMRVNPSNEDSLSLSLIHSSLRFRILRQHGYYISPEVFNKFTDERGDFMESIKDEEEALLCLYDAACLRGNKEDILDKAFEFTTKHLSVIANKNCHPLAPRISRALLYPIHKAVLRIESRYYMSYYEQDPRRVDPLLRFSMLEFDLLQSLHKQELQDLTRWWRGHVFPAASMFVRDRVVEAHLFSVGTFYEPKFSMARIVYTKVFLLLTVQDDIYDSFGTDEELEAYTEAIDRWDKSTTIELPSYMRSFYDIQYDTLKHLEDELAQLGMKSHVHYAVEELKRLSKAYMVEARWRKMKHVPSFDEYFANAIQSTGINCVLASSLLFTDEADECVVEEGLQSVTEYCKPQRALCVVGRFVNDLVDYQWDKDRYHVAGGVECYIKQNEVTEEDAYEAIRVIIEDAWKDMNEEIFRPMTSMPRTLLPVIHNFCCAIDFVYKNENGHKIVSERMKDAITLLFIQPISL